LSTSRTTETGTHPPRSRRALSALATVARAVNRSLDANDVLREAVEATAAALPVDGAVIRQLDERTGRLRLAAATVLSERFLTSASALAFGEGLSGRVVLRDQPLVVEDARHDEMLTAAAREEGILAAAVIPIHARESLLGTMTTFCRRPRRFRAADLELLQIIADQVGVALENARLYAEQADRASEMEAVARLKNEFAATISHELRTPMTIVKTAFDGLVRNWRGLSEERRFEYVRVGQIGAERLKRLLENMLLVARIEEQGAHLRVAPVRAQAVVAEAIAEVASRHSREIDNGLPELLPDVAADQGALSEVFVHLLDNAARYSERDQPIGVGGRVDGRSVVIEVDDRGCGIAPEDMPRLFQRFERFDRRVRSDAGTGLGLYIARRLVESMHGAIWADSRPAVGSTFYVRLPIAS
jgi:signal transduction histidine kinase